MLKRQFHAPARGGNDNLTFEHRVTKLELALGAVLVLSKGNAFNHRHITDNIGFVSHLKIQTELPHWFQCTSVIQSKKLYRGTRGDAQPLKARPLTMSDS